MTRPETTTTITGATLVARCLLALIFLLSGLNKLVNLDQTAQFVASQGLPAADFFAVAAAFVEIVGGLSLILGLGASLGAALLAIYLIPVTIVFHDFWNLGGGERQMQFIQFMKNLAIEGGLLYVFLFGAGEVSIDAWLARHGKGFERWRRRPSAAA